MWQRNNIVLSKSTKIFKILFEQAVELHCFLKDAFLTWLVSRLSAWTLLPLDGTTDNHPRFRATYFGQTLVFIALRMSEHWEIGQLLSAFPRNSPILPLWSSEREHSNQTHHKALGKKSILRSPLRESFSARHSIFRVPCFHKWKIVATWPQQEKTQQKL